ncbi:hypothetical protein KY284_037073 [Solanum tuberosum]|nr:hypothetical protein KY284_037073 [Solanum tuberosum]
MSRYDRIISCEMLEAVGHEFMEEFFTCCESALAEDGFLVLQESAAFGSSSSWVLHFCSYSGKLQVGHQAQLTA